MTGEAMIEEGMTGGIITVTKKLPLMLNKKSPSILLGAFTFIF
jgi:hypothetical protein